MKSTSAASLLLLSLLAIGCHSNPGWRRETALLRAEILDIEDKYAVLKSKYQRTARELQSITGQPIDDALLYEPATGGYSHPALESPYYSDPIIIDNTIVPESTPQSQPNPAGSQPGQLPIEQSIQSPIDGVTPDTSPSTDGGSTGSSSFNRGLTLNAPQAGFQRPAAQPITEVVVQPNATSGQPIAGITGDVGLNLLIQPRDARGQTVLQPGELTVSIIDPKAPAASRRMGLWKFLPEETALFFVNDELGNHGIQLQLPWEESIPTRPGLIVHVRYVTPDGRLLRTSRDVRIRPPAKDYSPDIPQVQDWTRGAAATAASASGSNIRMIPASPVGSSRTASPDEPQWRPVR